MLAKSRLNEENPLRRCRKNGGQTGIKVMPGIRRPESGRVDDDGQGSVFFVPRQFSRKFPSFRAVHRGIAAEWPGLYPEMS